MTVVMNKCRETHTQVEPKHWISWVSLNNDATHTVTHWSTHIGSSRDIYYEQYGLSHYEHSNPTRITQNSK